MTKTSECELKRLGEDAQVHEELKRLLDEQFDRIPRNCFRPSRLENIIMADIAHNNVMYLRELIELREKHGLPNDGKCYQCLGDRCSLLS